MTSILIIDGQPLAWRGSKMYEHLKTTSGVRTGCIYGSIENLIRMVKAVRPDSYVVVWDEGRSRWRRELHPGYKASRHANATPEEQAEIQSIRDQILTTQNILRHAGVHQVVVDGVEGDDLVGILSSGFDRLGTYDHVVIGGSDKDLHQLVGGRVRIYDPIKKVWIVDDAVALKHEGVGPSQICDLKALMGDSGDDIEGVHGVGLKRAAALIKEYGSLDAIFSPDSVKKLAKGQKWQQSVTSAEQIVRLARTLVTITTVSWMSPLSKEERWEIAAEIWQPPPPNRLEFVSAVDFYELQKAIEGMDEIHLPPPNFAGFDAWLPLT